MLLTLGMNPSVIKLLWKTWPEKAAEIEPNQGRKRRNWFQTYPLLWIHAGAVFLVLSGWKNSFAHSSLFSVWIWIVPNRSRIDPDRSESIRIDLNRYLSIQDRYRIAPERFGSIWIDSDRFCIDSESIRIDSDLSESIQKRSGSFLENLGKFCGAFSKTNRQKAKVV